MAAKKTAETWVLETGRPFAEYVDPQLDPKFKEILEIYEAQGSYGLEEKFPTLAKKYGTLNPHKLMSDEMFKSAAAKTKHYRADEDGTIDNIDSEAVAIFLYKAFSAINPKTHFNEKWGLPMPRALKIELEQSKKEQDEIQKLILRGGLGSRY